MQKGMTQAVAVIAVLIVVAAAVGTAVAVDSSSKNTDTKEALCANDFTFTAPSDLICNGQAKAATVVPNVLGTGYVTVKYFSDKDYKNEVPAADVKTAGTYYVSIDVYEGSKYRAASNLSDYKWSFTLINETADSLVGKTFHYDVGGTFNGIPTVTGTFDVKYVAEQGPYYSLTLTIKVSFTDPAGTTHKIMDNVLPMVLEKDLGNNYTKAELCTKWGQKDCRIYYDKMTSYGSLTLATAYDGMAIMELVLKQGDDQFIGILESTDYLNVEPKYSPSQFTVYSDTTVSGQTFSTSSKVLKQTSLYSLNELSSDTKSETKWYTTSLPSMYGAYDGTVEITVGTFEKLVVDKYVRTDDNGGKTINYIYNGFLAVKTVSLDENGIETYSNVVTKIVYQGKEITTAAGLASLPDNYWLTEF